ncbi:MAG: hypothetical protein IPL35_00440 [Sphingobacteriales bacterium]|nr:hypothetical protein [Sphingobacteriales bacterium]
MKTTQQHTLGSGKQTAALQQVSQAPAPRYLHQWANGTYIATLRSDDGKAEHHKISVLHH